MVESRWLRWIGPGVAALAAVGIVASTALGAGDRPWSPRACAAVTGTLDSALGPPAPSEPDDLRTEAWFRLDPVLDADGALRAQRLVTGLAGWRGRLTAELPRESFAAGPFGRIVLVGSDDGARSRLDAYDVERGCAFPIATETDVVRRATIDADSGLLYETRVARSGRADLGVWTRRLAGAAAASRVLEPMPADERFGRTFATEFMWDAAGDALAIQTCGEVGCRTRILGPAGGAAETIADPEIGRLIGFDRDRLVAYGACRGMPCPIISIDRAGGSPSVVDALGGSAAVVGTVDGARLVRVARDESGRRLRTTDLDGSDAQDAGPLPDGLAPVPPAPDPRGGTRIPPGWIVLAPDGRLTDAPAPVRSELRRITDGTSVPLDEVLR
jgi:YD repeat-containing protein